MTETCCESSIREKKVAVQDKSYLTERPNADRAESDLHYWHKMKTKKKLKMQSQFLVYWRVIYQLHLFSTSFI